MLTVARIGAFSTSLTASHSFSGVSAIGFSAIICFPAAIALRICDKRESANADNTTASIDGSLKIRSSSVTMSVCGARACMSAWAEVFSSQMDFTSHLLLF